MLTWYSSCRIWWISDILTSLWNSSRILFLWSSREITGRDMMKLSIVVHRQMCDLHFSRSFKIWRNWCNQRSIIYLVTLCITSKYLIIFDIIICNKHRELQVNRKNCRFVTLMFNNCDWCNLKQSWLIDLFIICWKLLFLCKSWLILSALILLLFNYLNLIYTFLLRFYLDLFALLTLVDLRIFLLRYFA